MIKNYFKTKGFTLIELMVALAIFAFMTAFLLAKYGTFNQGTLLTNLAYDVALTIRSAQLYGLDTKSAPGTGSNFSNTFTGFAYGVHFDTAPGNNKSILLFLDKNNNGIYDSGDSIESTYAIQRNSTVYQLCVGSGTCTSVPTLDITFTRPDPDASIIGGGIGAKSSGAQIILSASDGTTQLVTVSSIGQISVGNQN